MQKITVYKSNESFLSIHSDDKGIEREVYDHFSFKMPNSQFHPLVRKKRWDGFIRLYQLKTHTLPYGLFWRLEKFCQDNGYELDGYRPEVKSDFDKPFAEQFGRDLKPSGNRGNALELHKHQLRGFYKAAKYRRILLESSTSSGKSLIAYLLFRYFHALGLRGLYLVPTIGLVSQLQADFEEYSALNGFTIGSNLLGITAGKDKDDPSKSLYVSTWQSVNKQPASWYKQFGYVICDEVHTAAAKELTSILEACTEAHYKIGMTGSLQDAKAHRMALEGLFGPVEKIMTNAEAMEKKIAADLTIKSYVLKYSPDTCADYERAIAVRKSLFQDESIQKYQNEIAFIIESQVRNEFITYLVDSLKQTTLVLTQSIEHAKLLHKLLEEKCLARNVYLVYGETGATEREDVRQVVNDDPTAIVIASYGVFQTGISIKNIHNVIFASFSKSKIRLLQSIGRALRMSETKDKATVYDLADDFGTESFSMKHREERLKLYKREKFKVEEIKVDEK